MALRNLIRALFARSAESPSGSWWTCDNGHLNPASNSSCYVAGCSG